MSKQNELAQLADAVTVDGSGNLDVTGTVNAELVTVSSGVNTETRTFLVNNAHSGGSMYNAFGVYVGETDRKVTLSADYGDSIMAFKTNGSERMRIDSSGNFMVGKTSSNATLEGFEARSSGLMIGTVDNSYALQLRRLNSDGTIIDFRKGSSTVGSIGTVSNNLYFSGQNFGIRSAGSGLVAVTTSGGFADNTYDLGEAGTRWDDVRATNGTIQTSDFNEKQDIASLTATEMLVGKRISVLFKTFRWKDSVAKKGDTARTHTGIIAQDVQAAFTAEGLDAGDYALFISDTWWEHDVAVPAVEAVAEVTDEDGNVTTEAVEAVDAYTRTDTYETEDEAPEGATERTRLGIRYPELLSFVAAYNEQRFASIEARLTALEA